MITPRNSDAGVRCDRWLDEPIARVMLLRISFVLAGQVEPQLGVDVPCNVKDLALAGTPAETAA